MKRKNENEKNLLLVAGGVGINPVLSMLRHLVVEKDSWENLQEMIKKYFQKVQLYFYESLLFPKYSQKLYRPREREKLLQGGRF